MGPIQSQASPEVIPGKSAIVNPPIEKRARRFHLAARLLVFVTLITVTALVVLRPAYLEAERREAYLPQIQAEAAKSAFDGKLNALVGARLMQARDYASAAEALKHAWAGGEQSSIVLRALATCAAAGGERAKSAADISLALRSFPNDTALLQTREALSTLPPDSAADAVVAAMLPEGADALADSYSRGSFLNGLFEWWGRLHPDTSGFATRRHWAAIAPNDARVQLLWGQALERNRRFAEALAVLEHAAALNPASPEIHLELANSLDGSGRTSDATIEYLRCLTLKPNWLPALLGAGHTYLTNGLVPIAIASYLQATQAAPNSADAWIGLGRAYRNTGVDRDKAVAAFQTAGRLAPQREDYLDDYADALRQAVQWSAAESVLRRRLRSNPDDPLAHYLLAMVLLNNAPTADRQNEAEAETRTALRLFPHNPLADIQLAQIALSHARPKEAVDLLLDSLQSDPYNRNAMTVLARAYRQTNQAELADRVSKQADQLYQDQQRAQVLESQEAKRLMDPNMHDELAALYRKIGEPKKGLYEESMARLLRTNPKLAEQELQKIRDVRNGAIAPK